MQALLATLPRRGLPQPLCGRIATALHRSDAGGTKRALAIEHFLNVSISILRRADRALPQACAQLLVFLLFLPAQF